MEFPVRLRFVTGIIFVLVLAGCGSSASGGSGGIAFSPATLSCSNPVSQTTTFTLPSSVHDGDKVTETLDGKTFASPAISVANGAIHQADGSWTVSAPMSVPIEMEMCAAGGSLNGMGVMTTGTHTEQMLDASGKVLAQGSYTVTQ